MLTKRLRLNLSFIFLEAELASSTLHREPISIIVLSFCIVFFGLFYLFYWDYLIGMGDVF